MQSDEDILSLMDLLDMDEEVVDARAYNLIQRSTFTMQHLKNFLHLLQYKNLINVRENSECDNELEFTFISKLISNSNIENIVVICKIITTILMLNPSTVIFKSEHLIQQILAEIYLPENTVASTETELEKLNTTLLHLKICSSVLDAVEKNNHIISLPFLTIQLEYLICSQDENLLIYFLTNTVPTFFKMVDGYNILDRIWYYLKQSEEKQGMVALKVICCLSDYYLPVTDAGSNLESNIINENKFWDYILFGLSSEDAFARKQSIYLAKRALDYIISNKKNLKISSKSQFVWNDKDKVILKIMWDNFFVLIDSLEEKQSNIVLPSIKLFELVKDIGRCWINCAFNIGLKHDNTQVRLKCLYYNLEYGINYTFEAEKILDAINDIVLFDVYECNNLKAKFNNFIKDNKTLMNIVKALPSVKWSPVPLYYVTKSISNFNGQLSLDEQIDLIDLINDFAKIPCNNIVIRKCIHINISHLLGKCCQDLNWKKYIPVCQYLQLDYMKSEDTKIEDPFKQFVNKTVVIPQEDEFLTAISASHTNINFALLYYEGHDYTYFLQQINEILQKVKEISERQYSDKRECLKEVIFITRLYKTSLDKYDGIYDKININATKNLRVLLQFMISILVSDIHFDIEIIPFLFENLDYVIAKINGPNDKEVLLQMHKMAVICLGDKNTNGDKKVFSIFMLCNTLKSSILFENYKQELSHMYNIMDIIENVKANENFNKDNSGRIRNAFYEKSCEVVHILLMTKLLKINKVLDFTEAIIETGGHGCIKWILRIMNISLAEILCAKNIKFDVINFLHRMWMEIQELKSNSQYAICMKEMISLITHDALLEKPEYNNIVLLYCNQIIDLATVKNMPLHLLINAINQKISKFSHIVYVLSEILLNPVAARKENRIVENVLLEILQQPIYGANKNTIYFSSDIKFWAVSALSKISDPEVLSTVTYFMIKKIDDLFKNKQRYHSNSLLQRALRNCLQNLLFILLKSRKFNFENTATWSMEFLGRIPHQPFERICLEWYISLYFYLKGSIVNEQILDQLKSNNIPLQSQFVIIYWIVMHKLKIGICLNQEYEFLMELLLSNIMGPVFSIRLQAQYLSSMLYDANECISNNKLSSSKFAYLIKVVNSTLKEIAKEGDKSFKKLKNDYFSNHFDIVEDFVPSGIYWTLPRLTDASNNEIMEDNFLRNILSEIEACLDSNENDDFHREWKEKHRKTVDMLKLKANNKVVSKADDNIQDTGTIQKKYVPWKNMSDVNVYDSEKKINKTELIVVASLIDKLPNLGGMARTSEVFGVHTYVVDSLRHLQDKQFQGLSVSAERWVTVEEVRPGQPLKDYLMMKKAEGYSVVAAEQTSTSCKLQTFKFPKKTLLLLGNEKEGIPCDLLPLMDLCVEIPQQGVIRSLNVHVTAAIFIWEYNRQNMF